MKVEVIIGRNSILLPKHEFIPHPETGVTEPIYKYPEFHFFRGNRFIKRLSKNRIEKLIWECDKVGFRPGEIFIPAGYQREIIEIPKEKMLERFQRDFLRRAYIPNIQNEFGFDTVELYREYIENNWT